MRNYAASVMTDAPKDLRERERGREEVDIEMLVASLRNYKHYNKLMYFTTFKKVNIYEPF